MLSSRNHSIKQSLIANKQIIANAIGFQCVWFICVLGHSVYASMATLVLLIVYYLTFNANRKTAIVLVFFSVLGYLGDSAIAYAFELKYAENSAFSQHSFFAPLWLLCLWLAFATTLNHAMKWILKTPTRTLAIALFFVPFSYLAGIKISTSQFMILSHAHSAAFFLVQGIWWALLLSAYKQTALFIRLAETPYE